MRRARHQKTELMHDKRDTGNTVDISVKENLREVVLQVLPVGELRPVGAMGVAKGKLRGKKCS